MFIAEVTSKGKQGKSYISLLLRESFRVGSKESAQLLSRIVPELFQLPHKKLHRLTFKPGAPLLLKFKHRKWTGPKGTMVKKTDLRSEWPKGGNTYRCLQV